MKIVVRKAEKRKEELPTEDLTRPTLAEYAKAARELQQSEKILKISPTLLAGVAEECARWVPRFLDEATMRDALLSSAWCARPHKARIAELDRVICEAIERGKRRPHLTRAERKLQVRARVRR